VETEKSNNLGGRSVTLTSADERAGVVPKTYALFQNYPNPFNVETTIKFHVPRESEVDLKMYNVRGQLVRILVDGTREPGAHLVIWDGRSDKGREVAPGIYFYRFAGQGFVSTKKLVLLK
jgi:flagellar hook assembly protein FlgD